MTEGDTCRRDSRLRAMGNVQRALELAQAEREEMGELHPVHFHFKRGGENVEMDFDETIERVFKRVKNEMKLDAMKEGYLYEIVSVEHGKR